MSGADPQCPGVTVPGKTRPLQRCTECALYQWGATDMQPAMRQRSDGTWSCPNERVRGQG